MVNGSMPWQLKVGDLHGALADVHPEAVVLLTIRPEELASMVEASNAGLMLGYNVRIASADPHSHVFKLGLDGPPASGSP